MHTHSHTDSEELLLLEVGRVFAVHDSPHHPFLLIILTQVIRLYAHLAPTDLRGLKPCSTLLNIMFAGDFREQHLFASNHSSLIVSTHIPLLFPSPVTQEVWEENH